MKIKFDYSPNYSKKPRLYKQIKFIIFHYTGMQSEIASVKRLKSPKSRVSCHYLVNRQGRILQLIKDKNIAWHAGKSKWKKFVNLNKNSIGIELVNRGHRYGYENFTGKQIKSLIFLCNILKKKYLIKDENFLGHSDIAPLRKSDPGEKFPWKKLSYYNIGKWYKQFNKFPLTASKKKIDSLFFKNLYKIGYRYFKISERNFKDKKIIKSFQRRYSPKNVTGKIDVKTFIISHFLAK